jgi:hypothetical protein
MLNTGTTTMYKEYIDEVPYNTIKTWEALFIKELPWEYVGWSGDVREPFRHWAAYPEIKGEISKIWDFINELLILDGIHVKPKRAIANLFAHGDSSWLHKDCDLDSSWTVIIYLNSFWDINWGGETVLVADNEIIKSFAPTPGKIVAFKSNLLHGPRAVSREAPYPRFGLAFQCDSNVQRFPITEISSISVEKL